MRRILMTVLFALAITFAVPPARGQQNESTARIRTREQLGRLLDKVGPSLNIKFRQSESRPSTSSVF